MRDHVTEELISAYVDGELQGDELKLVEVLLTESTEHRQLLAEFQSMRASIWALPSLNLPADFHARVVSQIDQLAVSPAKEPSRRIGHKSKTRPWASVLLAAASLAAVVAFTVMLSPAARDVPGGPSVHMSRVFPVFFQDAPKSNYCMIYDVTVTPEGQQSKVVDKSLERLGIGIDPNMRLRKQLEKELLAIRESSRIGVETEATSYAEDPATPKGTDADTVEMIYISGTIDVLDKFGRDLEGLRNVGKEVSRLHYDMAVEPGKLGVMHRLHYSAREHFAAHSNDVPSDVGQAFRLSFRIELTSVSIPGAAAFPVPTFLANDVGPPNAGPPNNSGHILLIIRHVGAK